MRAVLFDLDGTLLDIDLESFLQRYFSELQGVAQSLKTELDASAVIQAIKESTGAMMRPHVGLTNREVFYADFMRRTGIDLDMEWSAFDRFYTEVFPTLGRHCRPAEGARVAVESALSLGLRVAVATNPIFPRIAIQHRIAWAGLDDLGLEIITSYETMHACKPLPEYFRQTAEMLGVDPTECMMVGDDRFLDMPAADTGMQTFYVGSDTDTSADYCGDLVALSDLLPRIMAD
ncbi:MAG: HAD family hydrolase [Coriobacteriia bacterium]|nr:HAD family hydrolase [Coriobacteriia bacterium]